VNVVDLVGYYVLVAIIIIN